jgi:hypothetical protein
MGSLVDNGTLYRRFDEQVHDGMRLGRNLWLDARSLSYMIENNAARMGSPLVSKSWERVVPILDQGSLGSCTGNAGIGALGTQPFYDKVGATAIGKVTDAKAVEKLAVQLYSDATKVDPYPGTWPNTDTGSSGLAICQVLKTRKTITGYNWASSAHGFLQLLQWGSVLVGMPWYEAFFQPDRNGFIDSNVKWPSSGIAGGHEIEAVAVDINATDLYSSVITFCNSWTTSWGDAGRFRMRLRTYTQLSDVDLKQFTI